MKDLIFLYIAKKDEEYFCSRFLGESQLHCYEDQLDSYSTLISKEFSDLKNRGVLFFIIDEKIKSAGAYRSVGANVTHKKRVTVKNMVAPKAHILLEKVLECIPGRLIQHIPVTKESHELIIPVGNKTAEAVIESISKLDKDFHNEIINLYDLSELRYYTPTFNGADIFQQQKDSIIFSLGLLPGNDFEIEKNLKYSDENRTDPFKLLLGAQVVEDDLIYHDASNFGDLSKISEFSNGTYEYFDAKSGAELLISNCNRKKLEQTLGVDLIVYNERYKSYLLVQYKRMYSLGGRTTTFPARVSEGQGESLVQENTGYGYRPDSDPNFSKELTLMNDLYSAYGQMSDSQVEKIHDWRIGNDFLFFKICGSLNKKLVNGRLVSGVYLPLSYTNLLLESELIKGPRGGRVITYNNCGPHLNNESFVHQAKHGVIGSKSVVSQKISEYIEKSLTMDKSVVLAEIRKGRV